MKASVLLVLALSGCAAGRKAARSEGRYDTGDPGLGWSRVPAGGADRAWYNAELGSTIYADSNCQSRFDDRPLASLADSMAFGMVMGEPLREEARAIDGREGLVRVVDGRLDGVDFRLGLAVLKKDSCVYDLTLVAPPSTFDQGWEGFQAVVDGFLARSH